MTNQEKLSIEILRLPEHLTILFTNITSPYIEQSYMEYENDKVELIEYIQKGKDIHELATLINLGTSCWSIIPQNLWKQIPIVITLKNNYPDLYKFMEVLTYG